MGIKPTNGNTEEIAFLWVIDPFNLTDKVIEFGETDTIGQNVGGGCVWDSNRNCIWTLDLDGKLISESTLEDMEKLWQDAKTAKR